MSVGKIGMHSTISGDNVDAANEYSTLLQRELSCTTHCDTAQRSDVDSITPASSLLPSQPSQHRAVILCLLSIFLVEIGAYLQVAPLNKIFEDIICEATYPETIGSSLYNSRNQRCKSTKVQDELATLRGWQMMFDYIPSIVMAIPYGLAADRYGRKPILNLSLFGFLLQWATTNAVCWWPNILPLRLIWLTSLFLFVGGGSSVLNALIFTITADVVSEQNRSTIFFYFGAVALLGEVIASPIAAILMQRDPWLPVGLGFLSLVLAQCTAMALPETKKSLRRTTDTSHTENAVIEDDVILPAYQKAVSSTKVYLRKLKSTELSNDWNVVLLLSTLLVTSLGRYSQEILLQLITKRYGWTWAKASYLLSLKAFISFLLLVVILPLSSYVLTKRMSLSAQMKDLWLARVSIVLLALGTCSIGLAMTPAFSIIGLALYALGAGFNLLTRSLLTSLVAAHHIGTLYNIIAIVDSISSLVAGPILSGSFRIGLALEGVWVGLPFIGAAVLFTAAAVVMAAIKIPLLLMMLQQGPVSSRMGLSMSICIGGTRHQDFRFA